MRRWSRGEEIESKQSADEKWSLEQNDRYTLLTLQFLIFSGKLVIMNRCGKEMASWFSAFVCFPAMVPNCSLPAPSVYRYFKVTMMNQSKRFQHHHADVSLPQLPRISVYTGSFDSWAFNYFQEIQTLPGLPRFTVSSEWFQTTVSLLSLETSLLKRIWRTSCSPWPTCLFRCTAQLDG